MMVLKNKEKKPKIGFIGGESRQNILDDLNFAVKNDFNYYETSGSGEKFDLEPKVIEQVRKVSQDNNISLNLHVIEFLPISSLIPEVSKGALKFAEKEIILAKEVGAKQITIHSGQRDKPNREATVAKNFEILIKNFGELVKFGRKYGIKIGLENSFNNYAICTKLKDLLKVVNSVEGLRVVLDVGHANTTGLRPLDYFKKVKNFVINIHIHDNDGKSDQHALIGEGNIDFKEFLRECKNSNYYGPFILELFPHQNVLKGREVFLNLWNQV